MIIFTKHQWQHQLWFKCHQYKRYHDCLIENNSKWLRSMYLVILRSSAWTSHRLDWHSFYFWVIFSYLGSSSTRTQKLRYFKYPSVLSFLANHPRYQKMPSRSDSQIQYWLAQYWVHSSPGFGFRLRHRKRYVYKFYPKWQNAPQGFGAKMWQWQTPWIIFHLILWDTNGGYTWAFLARGVLSHVLSRRHITSVGTSCSTTNATSVSQCSRSPASNLKTHTGVKQMQWTGFLCSLKQGAPQVQEQTAYTRPGGHRGGVVTARNLKEELE